MKEEILAAVGEIFFASKINGAASQLNLSVKFVKSIEDLIEYAGLGPRLIILDLNNNRFDPIQAIKVLKANDSLRDIPLVGFLSHVQVDLIKRAEAAGCDRVMPRSAFSANLLKILNHKGDEEHEELLN
jgi:CheY-like chemotaxis protein